jgi:hypothetical protein
MNAFAAEVEGRVFTIPAPLVATAVTGERMALALITGTAVRFGRDLVEDALAPGSCDLSLVRTGRCPLLAEHSRCLDALLGRVVAAEVESGLLQAVVEFAPTPEADRLWSLLAAGFPLSLSAGARVDAAEILEDHGDHRVIRVSRWRLDEISICVIGKDPAAHLRKLTWDENAAEIVRRMNEVSEPKRQAIEKALHLDKWRRWSITAGVGIAEKLGVDRNLLGDLLDERVAAHCEQLIADLAA